MLAIRMQRTGRKGSASFRIIVQDSRFSPTSGRVVARIGHYNPHTKEKSIDVDKVTMYLEKGAQPTPRVVRLLTAERVKMPKWVLTPDNSKKSKTKNATKLRKNQPKEAEVEEAATEEAPAKETKVEESPSSKEDTSEEPAADVAEEAPKEEVKAEETPTSDDEKSSESDK